MEEIISWLVGERERAKKRISYDRIYSLRDMVPSVVTFKSRVGDKRAIRDAYAIQEIFEVEASSPYATFLYIYANAAHPPPSEGDFKHEIEHLRRLIREHEREYAQREKLVITQSKKHIYVKRGEGKVILSGDTFPVKEELKKKGFKWDPSYKVWYKPERDVDMSRLLRELEAL